MSDGVAAARASADGAPYVDVTVRRGDELERDCRRVLDVVRPSWRADELRCTRFDAGITNTLVGFCRTADAERSDMVLLRVYGDNTEIVIDRADEKRNMLVLHAVGCAPPLYACFGNGLAYGFVSGSPIDRDQVRAPPITGLICEEMAKMHAIPLSAVLGGDGDGSRPPSAPPPPLFAKMRSFLDHYPVRGFEDALKQATFVAAAIPPRDELAAQLALLEQAVGRRCAADCRVVFCHNDLLLNNIIYDRAGGGAGRIAFIDYEYGGPNPDAYDIGNHFCEYAGVDDADFARYPDRSYQLDWIRQYLRCRRRLAPADDRATGGDDEDVDEASALRLCAAANKYALCAHLFWGLWCLVQAQYSRIDFDYLSYGGQRFAEYFARRDEFLAL